jgi:hypothetical protein
MGNFMVRAASGRGERRHDSVGRGRRTVKVDLLCILFIAALAAQAGAQDDAAERKAAVVLAKDELSRSLRAPADTFELVDVVPARWRDSSLGCPEKGVVYAPVLMSGYVVSLRTATARHIVHVGAGRAIVCTAKAAGLPTPDRKGTTTVTGLKRADEARADLAKALKVSIESIVIDFFRGTTWPDARLGCDKEPAPAVRDAISGYVIQLSHRGKTYTFHSDETGPPKQCAG